MKKEIKLIATDLDRTLLDSEHRLPEKNLQAIKRCIENGIEVVIATGRVLPSIPEQVRGIEGIRYYITANGAKVWDVADGIELYSRYLSPEAFESIVPLIDDATHMVEIFTGDKPYISRAAYDDPISFGIPEWFEPYIKATRTPVEDFKAFGREHYDSIENINFIFKDDEGEQYFRDRLTRTDLYALTQSFAFNFEIGGKGVSKAAALELICSRVGVDPKHTMTFGDNLNDVSMIEFAGVGVAVSNAVPEARAAADYVTAASEDGGVADAINKFIFGE
ncbi:MAG: HAD family hydrolase [Clostridiales Family XIII bacterium]|jgi:Cof subfamily protein (haloacid dehalogenase superfamily)|nr:HAD family hydrolase [Clostridiales Family XIII bacterium]